MSDITPCPFLLFLDKHEAVQKYRDNVAKQDSGVNMIDRKDLDSYAFHSSFIWVDTPEGYDYWRNLYIKLRIYIGEF